MNKSYKDLIFKRLNTLGGKSLEELHRKDTNTLQWGRYTDVLYSFLGVFVLGVYIFEKNKNSIYTVGADKVIRIKGQKQRLYSRKYIKENFDKFSELCEVEALGQFAEVYESIGNIIAIWPGGNEFKGKSLYYDVPEIFFHSHAEMEEVYIKYLLKKKVKDVALTRFITNSSPYVKSIDDILKYNREDYIGFVKHIVKEIETRADESNNLLGKNNV